MPSPNNRQRRSFSAEEIEHSERMKLRDKDRQLFAALARLGGASARELAAAVGRLISAQLELALSKSQPAVLATLLDDAQAPALRDAIMDLIADDVAETVHILTSPGETNDSGDEGETSGSGGEDAANNQREIHDEETDGEEGQEI